MIGQQEAVCAERHAQVGGDMTLEDLTRGVGWFLGPAKLQDSGSWISHDFACWVPNIYLYVYIQKATLLGEKDTICY